MTNTNNMEKAPRRNRLVVRLAGLSNNIIYRVAAVPHRRMWLLVRNPGLATQDPRTQNRAPENLGSILSSHTVKQCCIRMTPAIARFGKQCSPTPRMPRCFVVANCQRARW